MKRTLILAFVLAAGCASSEDVVEPDPANPAPAPGASARDTEIDLLKLKITDRRRDVARADLEIADIASNRQRLGAQPASEAKTTQMVQLNQAETDAKLRKQAAEGDIARMENQLRDLSGVSQPKTADEALDSLLASETRRERETEEGKRLAADQAQAEGQRKLKEAEQAKMADELAKANQKLAGGAAGSGDAVYDERFADFIIKVKAELQKFKRW